MKLIILMISKKLLIKRNWLSLLEQEVNLMKKKLKNYLVLHQDVLNKNFQLTQK